MMRKVLLLLVVFLCASGGGSALKAAEAKESFAFVVMGDSRPPGYARDKINPPPVFLRMIDQINAYKPDFVVHTGDMIMGTPPADVRAQWAAFKQALKRFKVPYYLVYGNHDLAISTQEMFGRDAAYYSFDHKGCHFVVLDSEGKTGGKGERRKITGRQLEWLRADLDAARQARRTFVFFHTPLWYRYYRRQSNFDELHALFAEHKVTAVFVGHRHWYRQCPTRDGVLYIITAGGGAELKQNEGNGGFFHFCRVRVAADDTVDIQVIRADTGETLPVDCVTSESVADSYRFMRTFSVPDIRCDPAERVTFELPVRFSNPFDRPIRGRFEYRNRATCDWRIEPDALSFELKPGEKFHSVFRGDVPFARLYPAAELYLHATLGERPVFRGPYPIRIDIYTEVVAAPARIPPSVDGRLDDMAWRRVSSYSHFVDSYGYEWADPQTSVSLCYDDERLYAAFTALEPHTDRLSASAERRDHWAFRQDDTVSLAIRIGSDEFLIRVNPAGLLADSANGKSEWNPPIEAAVSTAAGAWIVELSVPFESLAARPHGGKDWAVHFARNRRVQPTQATQLPSRYHKFLQMNEDGVFHDPYKSAMLKLRFAPSTK